MKILNLGCGTKTSSDPRVISIDWSVLLRLRKNRVFSPIVPLLIRGERLRRFRSLPDNILVRNLRKGIPFESGSVDVVYHSHFLEHLDRDVACQFLLEAKRVLKTGGIHRIVVPDLERICKSYVAHVSLCDSDETERGRHDEYVARVLEQSVRREAHGTSQQAPFRRFVENLMLGDARRRGETHQWMYDRINLTERLIAAGYSETHWQDQDRSLIPDWAGIGLDVNANGDEFNPGSLYVEAVK